MTNHAHTPTTELVSSVYVQYMTRHGDVSVMQVKNGFDRWHASELAAAEQRGAIKALRDAADDLEPGDQHESPYIKAGRDIIQTLRNRADYYHLQHPYRADLLEGDDEGDDDA